MLNDIHVWAFRFYFNVSLKTTTWSNVKLASNVKVTCVFTVQIHV